MGYTPEQWDAFMIELNDGVVPYCVITDTKSAQRASQKKVSRA